VVENGKREIRPAMTRLQNAQEQLSDALTVLESAADQAFASTRLSQTQGQKNLDSEVSELVNEVSLIEAKLGEAIAMIATIESVGTKDGDS
jgi:division protein CdvB (Snf7/Vps24/ESCRT-III family)